MPIASKQIAAWDRDYQIVWWEIRFGSNWRKQPKHKKKKLTSIIPQFHIWKPRQKFPSCLYLRIHYIFITPSLRVHFDDKFSLEVITHVGANDKKAKAVVVFLTAAGKIAVSKPTDHSGSAIRHSGTQRLSSPIKSFISPKLSLSVNTDSNKMRLWDGHTLWTSPHNLSNSCTNGRTLAIMRRQPLTKMLTPHNQTHTSGSPQGSD